MMMEQQIVLKNDELQDRWRQCVSLTCKVCSVIDIVMDAVANVMNTLSQILEEIRKVITPAFDSLVEVFNRIVGDYLANEQLKEKLSTYPHSYPHYPHFAKKSRVNTKGYSRPIMRCARSRC